MSRSSTRRCSREAPSRSTPASGPRPSIPAIRQPAFVADAPVSRSVDAGERRGRSRRCAAWPAETPLGRAVRAAIEATVTQDEDRWHEASGIAVEHGLRLVAVDALEGLAGVAAAAESWAECLRLAGAAARLRDETGYRWRFAFEQRRLDAAVAAATDALGPERARRRDDRRHRVGVARGRRLRGSGPRRAPAAEPRMGRADTDGTPGRHPRRRRPHEPTDRGATPHGSRHREDPPRPHLHQDRRSLTDRALEP